MPENIPLEQRAGRNIGIESLPVFIQDAAAPEVTVTSTAAAAPGGPLVTLMEAVPHAVRTPFTRGATNGTVFNKGTDAPTLLVWLDDGAGNRFLVADVVVPASDATPLDLSDDTKNPFNVGLPLCLCGDEKLVVQAHSNPS